ncbi:MAG: serine/threonine-protein kinase [Planctomycetota bacterium]|nr:serine/threonine-protein kinase [Planctomycetota bacterium]
MAEEGLPSGFVFEGALLKHRYQVEDKLGQGGMATIYKALDTELGRQVVVKVPLPTIMQTEGFKERFEGEIRGLIDVEHPHVVSILARGEHEHVPYFVTQFCSGGNLEDRIEEAKAHRLDPKAITPWLPKIADALDFIHQKGIVHRDIKPANILFDDAGNVYLSDFGVAKALGPQDAGLTATGLTLGSPEYMAPEQVANDDLGPPADQYALAVTVYECLSGTFPFTGDNPLTVLAKKCSEPAPSLAKEHDVPREISDVVMRALEADPEDRFENCTAFAAAFEVALWSVDPSAAPGGRTPTPAPRSEADVLSASGEPASADLLKRTMGGTVDFTGLTLLGHYKVGGRIARGGMGAVYLGVDTDLGKNVVLKVPHARYLADRDFLRRFEREVTQMLRIEHPSIVRVLAKGEHLGVPFYVLQYMRRGSLRERIKATKGKGMSAEDVLAWFESTAKALDFLHSRRMIHRDVKPGNILFDEFDHAYLSDFGIAKTTEVEQDLRLTATSTGVGSPRYMAPEQTGENFDGRADQYALATTVFEALTGQLPFPEGTAMEIMLKKVQETAPTVGSLVPGISKAVSDTVARALLANPEERFPTCRAFFFAFKRALREETPTAKQLKAEPIGAAPAATPAAPASDQAAPPAAPAPVAQPVAPSKAARQRGPTTQRLAAPSARMAKAAAAAEPTPSTLWTAGFLLAFVGVWLAARVLPLARHALPAGDMSGVTADLQLLLWAWLPATLLLAAGHGYLFHRERVTPAWAWVLSTLIGAAVAAVALWAYGRAQASGLTLHPMGAVAGAAVGAGLALCQWVALGAWMRGAYVWVLATVVAAAAAGAGVEFAAGRGIEAEYGALLAGGLVLALAQLFALRRMEPRRPRTRGTA